MMKNNWKGLLLLLLTIPMLGVAKPRSGFTMWMLSSQVNTIGNSFVFLTDKGHVVVMDGGMKDETPYLRGFIAALGNHVEAWIVSHPHDDHVGALTQILKEPKGIQINKIYLSRFPDALTRLEKPYDQYAFEFYDALDRSGVAVADQTEPGNSYAVDGMNFKILGVTNPELTTNPFNNSSMIVRVWDKRKSIVFLGDAGVECGNKVLSGPYRNDLNCDYLQVAHHGQRGCDEHFYRTIRFKACLWDTPTWVWNNDQGGGFDTGSLETITTRRWMDQIGITEHYVSCEENLFKLE